MTDTLAVWLGGERAGSLARDRRGELRFVYDESYRLRRGATALSRSMPKHVAEHGSEVAGPWFDNLLPDDDEVRRRWAADLGAASPSAFNLLEGMGIDCAGAVQVVPEQVVPDRSGALQSVSAAEIEQRLAALRRDVTAWNADDHGGRWSLGGAQGKFALARRDDGSWAAPTGRAASTHILKVGVARFAHADIAEFVSMRAAKHLGLSVAGVEIATFGAQSALVVQRYDRVVGDAGTRRFHQEDLCQALGHGRLLKYQADGGPGVAEVASVIAGLNPRDVSDSRDLFARSLVYNWLTAGVDAHAKNYSLLLSGDRARLAPLYDLTSGALLMEPDKVHYRAKSAMRIGGEYRLRNIDRGNLRLCADELRVDRDWLLSVAEDYRDRIPEVVELAIDEAVRAGGDRIPAGIKDRYLGGVRTIVDHAARSAGLRILPGR